MKYKITIVKEINVIDMKKALEVSTWIVQQMPVGVDYTEVRKVKENE